MRGAVLTPTVAAVAPASSFAQPASLMAVPMTGRAKSKHQITWLAMHAVEKEKEIRERNARGMLTKRETQAKYGF